MDFHDYRRKEFLSSNYNLRIYAPDCFAYRKQIIRGWLLYGFVLLYTLIDFLRTSVKTLKVALELESTAVESL